VRRPRLDPFRPKLMLNRKQSAGYAVRDSLHFEVVKIARRKPSEQCVRVPSRPSSHRGPRLG
jgi:hypothetical protein